jgi:hypothetical protein
LAKRRFILELFAPPQKKKMLLVQRREELLPAEKRRKAVFAKDRKLHLGTI